MSFPEIEEEKFSHEMKKYNLLIYRLLYKIPGRILRIIFLDVLILSKAFVDWI